jgi:flavin-dependent thymidylate synthase
MKNKVTLISYTQDALEVLLFTRNTRLEMSPESLAAVKSWSQERKDEELRHALNTIQSSFEFIDYVFAIQNVSRALTHQLVRHRVGTSFAQQAQRVVDMTNFDYHIGPSIDASEHLKAIYHHHMAKTNESYAHLLQEGADTQDARDVLPTGILSNIVFKANLRTLHDMALKRLCVKSQGEFQDVFRNIRASVLAVHPWAEPYIRVQCAVTGTCGFPDFPADQCPVKPHVYDPILCESYGSVSNHLWNKDRIQQHFDKLEQEGKTVQVQPTINRAK